MPKANQRSKRRSVTKPSPKVESELTLVWRTSAADITCDVKLAGAAVDSHQDDTTWIQQTISALPDKGVSVYIRFSGVSLSENVVKGYDRLIRRLAKQVGDGGCLYADLVMKRHSMPTGYLAINMGGPCIAVAHFDGAALGSCDIYIGPNDKRCICCIDNTPDGFLLIRSHLAALRHIVKTIICEQEFMLKPGQQPPTIPIGKDFGYTKDHPSASSVTVYRASHLHDATLLGTFGTSDGIIFTQPPGPSANPVFVLSVGAPPRVFSDKEHHIATDGSQYWYVVECEDGDGNQMFIASKPPPGCVLTPHDTKLIAAAIKMGLGQQADDVGDDSGWMRGQ